MSQHEPALASWMYESRYLRLRRRLHHRRRRRRRNGAVVVAVEVARAVARAVARGCRVAVGGGTRGGGNGRLREWQTNQLRTIRKIGLTIRKDYLTVNSLARI